MNEEKVELEYQKNYELSLLFDKWINQLEKNKAPIVNGNVNKVDPINCFARDGFFPGYFNQEKKVCFIGREPRKIGGFDFRETTKEYFSYYFSSKNPWWRHILYIVYGIKTKGKYTYEAIPTVNEILEEMMEKNDYGFACINISKFSNDDKNKWQTNKALVHRFLEDSQLDKTNFFEKELEILNPDVIITANLWDGEINYEFLNLCLPKDNFSETKNLSYKKENIAEYGKYNLNGRMIDFIDLYHFSAGKNNKYCYYNPVMEILFNKKRT